MKPRYVTTRKGVRIGYAYVPRQQITPSRDMDHLQSALLYRPRKYDLKDVTTALWYAAGMGTLLSTLWAKEIYTYFMGVF